MSLKSIRYLSWGAIATKVPMIVVGMGIFVIFVLIFAWLKVLEPYVYESEQEKLEILVSSYSPMIMNALDRKDEGRVKHEINILLELMHKESEEPMLLYAGVRLDEAVLFEGHNDGYVDRMSHRMTSETLLFSNNDFRDLGTLTLIYNPRPYYEIRRTFESFVYVFILIFILGTFVISIWVHSQLKPMGEIAKALDRRDPHSSSYIRLRTSNLNTEIFQILESINGMLFRIDDLRKSERRKTDELILQKKSLESANEELEQFAYQTSHDLRAPLRTILGFCPRALKAIDKQDTDVVKHSIERISKQAARLDTLINDILDLSRISLVGEEAEYFTFSSVVQGVMELFQERMESIGGSFRTEIEFDCELFVQKTRIQQVLQNLVSNAIKFHDPKKASSFVLFRSELEESEEEGTKFLKIYIEDNGLGISEMDRGKIFNMFYKGDNVEVAKGSGLGLYIVKKHVAKLNGTIELGQQEQTQFIVRVPLS